MSKNFNVVPILLFLFLSGILISSWFRFGYMYGGGDTGIPTYNPQVMVNIAANIWWESLAPGIPVAQGLTSTPLLFFLSIPQMLGASPVFIQAFLFFILLFLMGYGMYLLALSIFGKERSVLAIIAGVFYLFNPYMMIQIWHRFIHNSMFFVAFLPFLVMTWLWWIRKRKPVYLLLFLLVNFLAVYVFGTIAFIVAFWALLTLLTILEAVIPWKGREITFKICLTFLIGLFFWLLTNSWWLIPTFSVGSNLFVQQHSADDSLSTLILLSTQTVLPYTLRLINPFYLYWQSDFGSIYQNTFFVAVSWLFVVVAFVGFVKALREKAYALWSLLALVVIFLTKGAAPPFSFPYIFGFSHFFPLGVIRNPFEKLGVLLPFIYAILFALGLRVLLNFSTKFIGKFKTYLLLIIFILLNLTFFHPYFNGKLFGTLDKQKFVEVPKSYTQANEWIKGDIKNTTSFVKGRILHLPLPRSEDVTYNWQYGYSGVEPSAAIFTSLPSIARSLGISQIDDALGGLSLIFHAPYASDQAVILKMLEDFNVKYIILHKDIQWLGGNLYDPVQTEDLLGKLNFLKRVESFGGLVIYKVADEYFKPKLDLSTNFQLVYPSEHNLFWPYLLGSGDTMITPVEKEVDGDILNKATQKTIFPSASFIYPKKSFVLAVVNQLATNEATLNLLLSQFTKIKPALVQNGEIHSQELNNMLISSIEKIVKLVRSQLTGSGITKSSLDDYQQSINNILSKNIRNSRLLLYLNESDISLIFQVQLTSMEILGEKVDSETKIKLDEIHEMLKAWMIKSNLLPQNDLNLEGEQMIDRQKAFKFQIPLTGEYEILMTETFGREIFQDSLEKLPVSINGQTVDLLGGDLEDIVSFGKYDFKEGNLELGMNEIVSSNLAQSFDKLTKVGNVTFTDDSIKIEPQNQYGYIESQIPKAEGGDIFRVSFEVLPQNISGFYFQLAQDIDPVNKNGQKVNQLNEFIDLQSAGNNWQGLQFSLQPLKPTTQQAAVRFVVVSNSQIPPPAILIKNLKIVRVLNANIVLRSVGENKGTEENGGQVLSINQEKPNFYKGRVEIKNPAFLIFSETFHPGWKLKLIDGNNTFVPQKHLLANLYGNAWYVDNIGSFDFSLEFAPQRMVNYGMMVAAVSYVGISVLILLSKLRR